MFVLHIGCSKSVNDFAERAVFLELVTLLKHSIKNLRIYDRTRRPSNRPEIVTRWFFTPFKLSAKFYLTCSDLKSNMKFYVPDQKLSYDQAVNLMKHFSFLTFKSSH